MSHHWSQSAWDPEALILVVDDSRLNRELLITALESRGHYHFLQASHGGEAIRLLADNPGMDLILLDLLMPRMDGFEFLRWRQGNPPAQDIPVIVNSSLDDMDSLSAALAMDCYDYFVKPMQSHELKLVLPLKVRNAINARRMLANLRKANQRMTQELGLAARYQGFLLPRPMDLPGLEAAWLFRPCQEVGGDYFDFFPLPQDRLGLVVADVAGHGVASAMTASILKALLPGYLERTASPAAALEALNGDLLRLTEDDGYVTAFVGLYDPAGRELTWSSAGHPPPLSLPPGRPLERLSNPGFLLGVFSDNEPLLSFEDRRTRLEPGHRLVLYTDGFIEAADPRGERMGLDRLEGMVSELRELPLRELVQRLEKHLDEFSQGDPSDDVALIAVDFQ